MFKHTAFLALALILGFTASPAANAAKLRLDSFTDQTTEPINLPATKLLMASVGTSVQGGGPADDALTTTVTIGGSVLTADIAEICVDYNSAEVACASNPNPLTGIVITLAGTQSGGTPFDYRVTLNPSAAGKTISLSVGAITSSNTATDNIPLPQSTATRNISDGTVAPEVTLRTPSFDTTSVTSSGATLYAEVTNEGTPTATQHGTVWNTATNPTESNNPSTRGSTSGVTTYDDARTGMPSADQIFFKAYAYRDPTYYFSTGEGTFYTEPANDPLSLTVTGPTSSTLQVDASLTAEGGEERVIVLVSTDNSWGTDPVDGTVYAASAAAPFGDLVSGNDYVAFSGTPGSFSLTNLAAETTYYVKAYTYSGTGSGISGVRYKTDGTPLTASGTTTAAATPPVVTLDDPAFSSVTSVGATLNFSISNVGVPAGTEYGTVWNTATNPTTGNNPSTLGTPTVNSFNDARTGMPSADQIFFKAYVTQSGTPYYSGEASFFTYPANDPLSLTVTNPTSSTLQVNSSLTAEGGEERIIVLVSTDNTWGADPVDGAVYTASAAAPFGDLISGNDYVAYAGTVAANFTLSNLTDNTTYYVKAYTYSGTGSGISGVRYKTDGTPLTASGATTIAAAIPTLSNPTWTGGLASVTATTATLGATQDSNGGALVTSQGVVWNTTGSPTTSDNTKELFSGADLGDGPFSGLVDNLTASTQIHFAGYATNSEGSGYSPDGTIFWTEPANQPTGFGAIAAATSLDISWSAPGANEGTIVIMDTADPGDPSEVPVDGNEHNASNDWNAAGTGIGSGTAKVVFRGVGSSVNVINLTTDTPYFVRIYRYAGSGTGQTGINYREETPLQGTGTPTNPVAPTLSLPVRSGVLSDVTATSATLGATQDTKGNPATVTARGIVWNTTGSPTISDNSKELQTGSDLANEAFSGLVDNLNSATQIHFAGYAFNGLYGYSPDGALFWTEPANQPTSISITPDTTSMSISWNDPIGAKASEGAIVIMRADSAPTEVPADGSDASVYSPNSDWDLAGALGASKVVFTGTGNTVNVTNLVTDTTYYVAIYEYAGSGTGETGINYLEESPLTGSGTPFSTLPDQATNLQIRNIGSTSMSLYWSEGSGDGSIVVMKQGSAVDVDPPDGTEYTADSVFSVGTDLGSGNYVVYRGTGSFVNVTGLPEPAPLTFHAAVYTYTGVGSEITYLRTSPARANASTSPNTPHNVAVLNIDENQANCTTGCHGMHGSPLVPRGADQETMCVTCHNPSGLANALENNFSLHTNSKGTPPESPGEVDCGGCHELHNNPDATYSYNPVTTTSDYNLYYLKKDVTEYVTGALSEDMVMHAEGAWVLDTDTYRQGPCQICHTDISLPYTNTSSDTTHQGGSQNCKGCHTHDGGFSGAGGDCTGCHNSLQGSRRIITGDNCNEFSGTPDTTLEPECHLENNTLIISSHLNGTLDAADCEVCHDQSSHQAGQVKLFDPDGGASISITSGLDPRTNSAEAAKLTAFCEACHDSDGATRIVGNETSPFTTPGTAVDITSDWANASHNTSGSVSCFGDGAFGCHGSGHGGQKLSILAPAETGPGTNNSDEREQFCFNCHDGTPASNIFADFTGTLETTSTVEGVAISNRHDVMPSEQSVGVVTCKDCHQPHLNSNANPVANLDTGLPLDTYVYTNHGGVTDPTFGISEPDYIVFCLACHDNDTTGMGVTMPSSMTNIGTGYSTDRHGLADGSGHKNGTLKSPWNTSSTYAALNCTTCHGSHGTGNIHNLRTEITVGGVAMEVGASDGRYGYTGTTDFTYNLPAIGTDGQEDLYWGAWCTFCHTMSSHGPGSTETGSCNGGSHWHYKGGKSNF